MGLLEGKLLAAALSEERVAACSEAERRNAHHLIGRSFAGSKTTSPEAATHWVLGPPLADFEDPERASMAAFLSSFPLALGNTMLCTHGASGQLSAVLVLHKYDKAPGTSVGDWFRFAGNVVARALRGEVPDTFSKGDPENRARRARLGKGFWNRAGAIARTMESMHGESADAPHVYVAALATDPDHQRRGFGGSLMRAALRAADDAGLPAYLETGDTNRKFYEGFGFEVVKTYRLSDGTDEGWPDYDTFHAMVRKARNGTCT